MKDNILINDEIKHLKSKYDKLIESANQLRKLINEKQKQLIHLDYEKQYIKYYDWINDYTVYMKVDWITDNNDSYPDWDFAYMFRGYGFSSEFTGFGDATSFYWDFMYEFNILAHDEENLIKCINNIQIITKEEFDNELDNAIKKVIEFSGERNK